MQSSVRDAVANLTPRNAGPAAVEPQVEFERVDDAVHATNRCPYTCGCRLGTDVCIPTGHTLF